MVKNHYFRQMLLSPVTPPNAKKYIISTWKLQYLWLEVGDTLLVQLKCVVGLGVYIYIWKLSSKKAVSVAHSLEEKYVPIVIVTGILYRAEIKLDLLLFLKMRS